MLTFSLQRKRQKLSSLAAVFGGLVFALGATAFAGYLSGIDTAYGWGNLTRMATHTYLGFCVLGVGALIHAWHADADSPLPRWAPLLLAILVMTISVGLWQAQSTKDMQEARRTAQLQAQAVGADLQARLTDLMRRMTGMARRWAFHDGTQPEHWRFDAQDALQWVLGIRAVEWIDAECRVQWVEPEMNADRVLQLDLSRFPERMRDLNWARQNKEPMITAPQDLYLGGRGFYVIAPIPEAETFDGFMIAVVNSKTFMASSIQTLLLQGFTLRVADQEGRSYLSPPIEKTNPLQAPMTKLNLPGSTEWTIHVEPTRKTHRRIRTRSRWILLVGFFYALLSGLAVHFALRSANRAQIIEGQKQHLEEEVRHRTEDLQERIKELDCLRCCAEMLRDQSMGPEVFQGLIEALPDGFHYPAHTCAKLEIDGKTYTTKNFSESSLHLVETIHVHGKECGSIQACLCTPLPAGLIVAFLPEEKTLLKNIVRMIEQALERHEAVGAMESLNQDLKRSNQELEQFAYVASHDLQEPLRMVSSFSQLLSERYKDQLDARAQNYIGFAVDGAMRMQTLINDLLEFSRLGTRESAQDWISLQVPLENALKNLRTRIEETRGKIHCDPLPEVYADGGTIQFTSKAGQGTQFSCTLLKGRRLP